MKKKLLFVCEANLNRSPTFEHYFKNYGDNYDIRSAGTLFGYPNKLDKKLLEWADIVYVMDMEQMLYIYDNFRDYVKKIKVIGISDQYDPDDKKLIEIIKFWKEHLM